MSRLSRAELQKAFNNARLIARFEEMDSLLDDLVSSASSVLATAQEALAAAEAAQNAEAQPYSELLTAITALPSEQVGAVEVIGANQVAIRAIDSDDAASLVTQAFLGPYFASLTNAADDAAAAAAAVPVNGLYRTGSAVKVRIA